MRFAGGDVDVSAVISRGMLGHRIYETYLGILVVVDNTRADKDANERNEDLKSVERGHFEGGLRQ